MTQLFDPGLQPERTELAWRRTCLALAVGSLIAMRLLPAVFGEALWAVGGVAGLIAAAWMWLAARRRYRCATRALRQQGDRATMPDGRLLLALASVVTAIAVTSVAVVLWVFWAPAPT